jgi:hypothetical protein
MSELKQIKRHHERQLKNMDKKLTMYQIHPDDVSWLIKQAERVEELEEERDEWKNTSQYYYMMNQELREQNQRYGEAMVSALSEIEYALYSQKSLKVKEHYLKNAKRYINQALER